MSDAATEYAAPVPRAVREAARRAEELAREAGMANVPGDDGSQAPGESPQQLQDLSSSAGQASASQAGTGDSGGVPPQPVPVPQADAGGTPPTLDRQPEGQGQSQAPPDDWEQRYRTLQGQSRGQIQGLQRQVEQLHQLLATLQHPPAAAPAPVAPAAAAPVVTGEDREVWGDELPAAVSRWAGEALSPRLAWLEQELQQLRAENEQLRGGQQQQGQFIARNAFEAQLDADPQLGNGVWRQLNNDGNFFNWLQIVEPYSGQIRLDLLKDAAAQGDAIRAAGFFKTYLAEHTAPPPPRPAPHTNGTNGAVAGRMRLEELAAPGRAAASGTNGGASSERRLWTGPQISAFYDDVVRGRFRGRDADKARIESELEAAVREGRIVQ